MNPIYIHKSDSTIFANVNKFLTFHLETDLDLTGWQAKFILGEVEKTIDDISSRSFEIILGAKDTKQLRLGEQYGTIILTDSNGNIKTVTNSIPFEVTTAVVENEYQEIDLTIPQSSGVDIKLKVGMNAVTSINGMTGEVVLDIPSIEGLATEKQLQEGLEGKQDKGDYALASDIPEIPTEISAFNNDVGYVKNTDYATATTGGVVKFNNFSSFKVDPNNGIPYVNTYTQSQYNTVANYNFISKGTLENIKDDYVKRGITENGTELTADELASAKAWLKYADKTDILQAIASIPQFKLSIVDALPETGEKMTLYFVPKDGEAPDIYNEYVWIEETSSFEFLGSTAVDLTDYVKNTDYATTSSAGVLRAGAGIGISSSTGQIYCNEYSLESYKNLNIGYFVAKGTLENIKDDYVKRGLTENSIELTEEEQANARTWLNAVGKEDYANNSTGGVIKTNTNKHALYVDNNGYLYASPKTTNEYNSLSNYGFIAKGTLDNVLTQYAKTVSLTQADYDALETKDANTLYLIEE